MDHQAAGSVSDHRRGASVARRIVTSLAVVVVAVMATATVGTSIAGATSSHPKATLNTTRHARVVRSPAKAKRTRTRTRTKGSRTTTTKTVANVVTVKSAASTGSLASVQYGHDQEGTSWYPDQTQLTPQLVTGGSFGQLFKTNVNGQTFAQPLVADGVLLVETSQDWIYGMNPQTGAIEWSRNVGTPVPAAAIGCADIGGGQGIVGTPVVDQNTDTEYFTANSYVSGTSGPSTWAMHAVNVLTGAEQPGFPVLIQGSAANDPTSTFNATYQLQRPGLLLMNGVVYAAFGSHCDLPPTEGFVAGVTETGTLQTLWSTEVGGAQPRVGGIWQAGGALISDGPGQILFATGNGNDTATPTPGNTPPNQLAQTVTRLQVQPDGSLKASDFFQPYDSGHLNQIDGDLGSGAPVLLPPSEFGTPQYPDLAIEIGKEGYLYVLNAKNLGGFQQGPNGSDNVLARIGPIGGVWGKAAVWGGDGGYLYFFTSSSTDVTATGSLMALKYGVTGTGMPTFSEVGTAADPFAYGSGQPIVTSSGTTSGSAILWDAWTGNSTQPGGELRAYSPIPVNGTLPLLWEAPIGYVDKWTPPGVYDVGDGPNPTPMVYIPTTTGSIYGFGAPVAQPLTGAPVAFGDVTVGQSATINATFTATEPLTVTGVTTTAGEFTLGAPTPALPVSLTAGQTLTVPVTFTPTTPGTNCAPTENCNPGGLAGAGGTLTVATSAGNYSVGENGYGIVAGALLTSSPQAISFGGVAQGQVTTQTVTFTDEGAQPCTITSITSPSAPFAVSGLPAIGTVLTTGQSVTVAVTYSPSAPVLSTDNLVVNTDVGGSVDVPLSGNSAAPGMLSVTPDPIAFGNVPVGDTVYAQVNVSNTGATGLEITKSKPPIASAFHALTSLVEGSGLAAGATVKEYVAFTPTSVGTFNDVWVLNGSGNSTLINEQFVGTGVAPVGPTPPSAGGWTMSGSAKLVSGAVQLTQPTQWQLGTAKAPHEVPTDGLSVAFTANLGGGTGGGDGVTFTLASPTSPTFVGGSGGGLGYVGITGTAVVLRTFKGAGEPSGNFVGIADGPNATNPIYANYLQTNTAVPPLRNTPDNVVVTIKGTQITVALNGTQVLQYSDPNLPARAYPEFTGTTALQDDLQTISNVSISSTSRLAASPTSVTAGTVAVGSTTTAPVTITNSGDSPVVFEGATVPAGPFSITGLPAADTVIAPGASLPATVTFSPTASGAASGTASIATDDGGLTIPLTGTATGGINWSLFGSATHTNGQLVLTPATTYQAGSALDPTVVPTNHLKVSFTEAITGGTGADGMTMTLASPTSTSFLGANGGGLGYVAGPTGTAVVFRTYQGPVDPSNNFVAIADGANLYWPNYLATNTTIPALQNTTNQIVVTVSGTLVTVTMNGTQVLQQNDPNLPPNAEVLFTAGTGGLTNQQAVSNVVVAQGIPDPGLGGWQLNGTSTLSGSTLQLNPAVVHDTGTALWPTAIAPTSLNATYTSTIGPGTGADGMAFMIVPSTDGATALGAGASAYGWGHLGGVAIAEDTYKNANDPSANFIGITDSENAYGPVWLATSTAVPNLHGSHTINVSEVNGTITVSVDGTQYLSVAGVPIPASALVGFAGASGGLADIHSVSATNITYDPQDG